MHALLSSIAMARITRIGRVWWVVVVVVVEFVFEDMVIAILIRKRSLPWGKGHGS